jgi:hypothetical protein
MRGIDVVGAEQAQLLPPKAGVVGEGEHHPVANSLGARHGEDRLPLLVARYPRQPGEPAHDTAIALAPERLAWGVPTAPDRVVIAPSLLHEVVVEKPDSDEALLHGRVR